MRRSAHDRPFICPILQPGDDSHINSLWSRYLELRGFDTGNIVDDLWSYLVSLDLTPDRHRNDMFYEFWLEPGPLETSPP